MSLLNNYLQLILSWASFLTGSTFRKSVLHAIADLTEAQRKTVTHTIRILDLKDEDYSVHYKLYSRDKWSSQDLFKPIICQAKQFSSDDYIQIVGNFTTIRKTGKKIPFTSTCRDPMSPKYHPNLIWGMTYLQMSMIAPLYKKHDLPPRSLPIQWNVLPKMQKPRINDSDEKWLEYKLFQKENNRSRFFVNHLVNLRKEIDLCGYSHKKLLVSLDGDFCNKHVLNMPRDRTELILRTRKNIKLCFQAKNEGKRFYSVEKFTPEEIRQNEEIPWKSCLIYHGGKLRTVEYKEVNNVLWQGGAKRQLLRVIVIRPIPYKTNKSGKTFYRQPAYLLVTDLIIDSEKILQAYFDRWEIEVNHKDEKHILGLGHAQVRNEESINKQPALLVASYSALLLASIQDDCLGDQEGMKYKSEWYKNARRPSCNSLRKKLIKELEESDIDIEILIQNAFKMVWAA